MVDSATSRNSDQAPRAGKRSIVEDQKATPVIGEYDVVVVGGGPAGLMAATAAARAGRSTVLIERYGFLGGAGTMGGLSTFCGLHARVFGEDRQVVHGLTDELLGRIDELGGLNAPHLTLDNRILAQAFDISVYKMAADDLVLGSGAEILFHTMVVGVAMASESVIDAVFVESKSGRGAIRGRVFIDGSGDGDLAAWSGAPYEKSEALLYPSLMFRINGVNPEKAGKAWKTVVQLMDQAEKAGTHHFPRKKPIVRPQRNPLEWRANLTQLSNQDGGAVDGTDVRQLTFGEIQGRRQTRDAFAFIKAEVPGFDDSYIVDLAPQIGIRETRRIIGSYQLTKDDVLNCADFDDSVGVNGWPIEAHVAGDVEFRFPNNMENTRGFHQLPFRMLVPQVVGNLYVVGRCASMTQYGQSSARVTGPCFAMGQAAGSAADLAISAGTTCGNVDITKLQRKLVDDGVYLGDDVPAPRLAHPAVQG